MMYPNQNQQQQKKGLVYERGKPVTNIINNMNADKLEINVDFYIQNPQQ